MMQHCYKEKDYEKGSAGRFQYLLFDLDGTLTDPKAGITGCVRMPCTNSASRNRI